MTARTGVAVVESLSARFRRRSTVASGYAWTSFRAVDESGTEWEGIDSGALDEVGLSGRIEVWPRAEQNDSGVAEELEALRTDIDSRFLAVHRAPCPPARALGSVAELNWGDDAGSISEAVLQDLTARHQEDAGAFAVLSSTPFPEHPDAEAYIQLRLRDTDELVVEVRSEYSFYGFALDDRAVNALLQAGFGRPPEHESRVFADNFRAVVPAAEVDQVARLFSGFVEAVEIPPTPVRWKRASTSRGALDPEEDAARARLARSLWRHGLAERLRGDDEVAELDRIAGVDPSSLWDLLLSSEDHAAYVAAALGSGFDELLRRLRGITGFAPTDSHALRSEVDAMSRIEKWRFVAAHLVDGLLTEEQTGAGFVARAETVGGAPLDIEISGGHGWAGGRSFDPAGVLHFGSVTLVSLQAPLHWDEDSRIHAIQRGFRGVNSPCARFAHYRGPRDECSIVGHDGTAHWVVPLDPGSSGEVAIEELLRQLTPAECYELVADAGTIGPWTGRTLSVDGYLLALLSCVARLGSLRDSTARQVVVDIWNGGLAHAVAVGHADLPTPTSELGLPLHDVLPGDLSMSAVRGGHLPVSPSLVPGGFPPSHTELGVSLDATAPHELWIATSTLIGRCITSGWPGLILGYGEVSELLSRTQRRLERLPSGGDPLLYIDAVHDVRRWFDQKAARLPIDCFSSAQGRS